MFGKVKIGNEEFEMVANAATAYRFKQVFKGDLLKFFTQSAKDGEADTEPLQMLAFIMIKQAEKADFTKVNEDMYVDWLEELNQFDLINSLAKVVELYQKTEQTSTKQKNGDAQQRES